MPEITTPTRTFVDRDGVEVTYRRWLPDGDPKAIVQIARIDEHPIAEGHPFDTCIANAFLFQLLDELVGDRAHMALRAAGRDNHGIAERGFARQVDDDDLISLGVLERLRDQAGERGGSRGGAFRAARFEFRELLMQNVRPQRKNPSFCIAPVMLQDQHFDIANVHHIY